MEKFLIFIIFNSLDTIDVPYFKNYKINLDGKIDKEIYEKALKIPNLLQTLPHPFQKSPESTAVFILQTDKGLYVGFYCVTNGRKPDKSPNGDHVALYLDTYCDRENAYMFGILANGDKNDARIWSGEYMDFNVNFLWEGKVLCFDDHFEAEFFIPYTGIMGKKGEWGIDIERKGPGGIYEVRLSPYDGYKDKFHVSRFKIIKMVNFRTKLITIEIQPILLIHKGIDFGYRYNFKYEIGSNLYFKFKDNVKFAFTFNPDFGEVEADPFRLNLWKYPLFYSETRPFL